MKHWRKELALTRLSFRMMAAALSYLRTGDRLAYDARAAQIRKEIDQIHSIGLVKATCLYEH